MRVCFVASHAHGFDGWGRYTVEVVRGVRALGVEPVLVTASPELDPVLVDVEHHVILPPLFSGRFSTARTLARAPKLRRILKTCDLVHCTVELYAPLVAMARPRWVPFVLNAHGTWAVEPLLNPAQRPVFSDAFRRADRLLVLSHFTLDWMAQLIELPSHEVLTGGVHPADYERVVDVDLPEWARRDPFILSVGMVKKRKGQHVTLEALGLLRESLPDVHYVIIGKLKEEHGYVSELRQRAAALGLSDRVHLLGTVSFDELVAWYQQAAVFSMLSTTQGTSFEGLGLVYLEAGAAGTPSVGTLGCGAEEAIIDGETGFLVPQDDAEAAADALRRLLSDPGLRARMGQAARERAHRLSWQNLAERLLDIYADLTGSSEG